MIEINNMKFLWLGKNKEMRIKEARVADKIHANKNKFTADMLVLEKEAKSIHKKHTKQLEKSEKINQDIEDLASQLSVIMGGRK